MRVWCHVMFLWRVGSNTVLYYLRQRLFRSAFVIEQNTPIGMWIRTRSDDIEWNVIQDPEQCYVLWADFPKGEIVGPSGFAACTTHLEHSGRFDSRIDVFLSR